MSATFSTRYRGRVIEGQCNWDTTEMWVESLDMSPLDLLEAISDSGLDPETYLRGLDAAIVNETSETVAERLQREREYDEWEASRWANEELEGHRE